MVTKGDQAYKDGILTGVLSFFVFLKEEILSCFRSGAKNRLINRMPSVGDSIAATGKNGLFVVVVVIVNTSK